MDYRASTGQRWPAPGYRAIRARYPLPPPLPPPPPPPCALQSMPDDLSAHEPRTRAVHMSRFSSCHLPSGGIRVRTPARGRTARYPSRRGQRQCGTGQLRRNDDASRQVALPGTPSLPLCPRHRKARLQAARASAVPTRRKRDISAPAVAGAWTEGSRRGTTICRTASG